MGPPDWSRLGLSGNPFVNVLPGTHLEWVEVPPALEEALAARPFRVELVGDKGAGKSTLLRGWAAQHAGARYHYVAPGAALEVEVVPAAGALALDEANNARPRALAAVGRAAAARGVSLLVASHFTVAQALGGGFRTFALADVAGLDWVRRRVEAATLPGARPFDFPAVARALFPRVSRVAYALQRVLYELAEDLARGAEYGDALVERALDLAAKDETVAPALRR